MIHFLLITQLILAILGGAGPLIQTTGGSVSEQVEGDK